MQSPCGDGIECGSYEHLGDGALRFCVSQSRVAPCNLNWGGERHWYYGHKSRGKQKRSPFDIGKGKDPPRLEESSSCCFSRSLPSACSRSRLGESNLTPAALRSKERCLFEMLQGTSPLWLALQ